MAVFVHFVAEVCSCSAMRAGVQTLWCDGLPVEPSRMLQVTPLSSSPEPRAKPTSTGQCSSSKEASSAQRLLQLLGGFLSSTCTSTPCLGIMELSMYHILLWITLKAEGNKKENLPFPVSEWFPNFSMHQVWEKKAKPPLLFKKFEHLTTLSPLMNHLLNSS